MTSEVVIKKKQLRANRRVSSVLASFLSSCLSSPILEWVSEVLQTVVSVDVFGALVNHDVIDAVALSNSTLEGKQTMGNFANLPAAR